VGLRRQPLEVVDGFFGDFLRVLLVFCPDSPCPNDKFCFFGYMGTFFIDVFLPLSTFDEPLYFYLLLTVS
jgi:hypothetical protein